MPIKKTALAVGIALVAVIAGFALVSRYKSPTPMVQENSNSTIGASSEDAVRIPHGKQDYKVQQSGDARPRIKAVSIDPPDVRVGNKQTLSITIDSPSGNPLVTTETTTDHKTFDLVLGLAKEEGSLKTYEGSWTVEDTHDATYYTKFIARAGADKNEVTIAWTDPCGIQNGGDWTMTDDCTISAADGVDNGNITVASGTLTLNAPFAFNPGKALTLSGGTILFGGSSQITKTNIWQIDADGDGLPANSTMYLQSSAPANGVRRYTLATSTIDCIDTNATVPTSTPQTVDRGDGSFDWDCDGNIFKSTSNNPDGGPYRSGDTFLFCQSAGNGSCNTPFFPLPACGQTFNYANCHFGPYCNAYNYTGVVSCL